MSQRTIDCDASSITIRTRAKGLLSRLAHDLEILATGFAGTVDVDGDNWTAKLTFPVRGLEVAGVVRKNRVVRNVLSSSDVADIQRKIREEVFSGGQIDVTGTGSISRAKLKVAAQRGSQEISVALETRQQQNGKTVVTGNSSLSLRQLGVKEVKAPLGAFKVADEIELAVRLVLDGVRSRA